MKENAPKIYLYKRVVDAKLFIDENFRDKISLEHIASAAHFSSYHFHRIFKESYGKTPHQYLTYLRIKEAKRLLETGKNVKLTAESVGFESQSSFIRLFKKYEGLSPNQYAKQEQAKDELKKANPLQHIPDSFAQYLGWSE